MNPELFLRQLDIIHPEQLTMRIAVIGAGGIGSWTTLTLAKMGCSNISVFDFDQIEIQNVGSQLYVEKEIGGNKVEILAHKIEELTSVGIASFYNKIDEKTTNLGDFHIVVGAVDNIETRKIIFELLKGTKAIYIDGRMSAELLQVFAIHMQNPDEVAFYEDSLFPPEEAEEAPCTAQAVVYNCFLIAGIITSLVAKIANNGDIPRELVMDLTNYELIKDMVD